MADWLGIPDIKYLWHGSWSSPEIEVAGLCYYEEDITDFWWEDYTEEFGREPTDDEFDNYLKDHASEILYDMYMFTPSSVAGWVLDDIDFAEGTEDLISTLNKFRTNTDLPDGLIDECIAEAKGYDEYMAKELENCKAELVSIVPAVNGNRYDDDSWVIGEIEKCKSFDELYSAVEPMDQDAWETYVEIIDEYYRDNNEPVNNVVRDIVENVKEWVPKYWTY